MRSSLHVLLAVTVVTALLLCGCPPKKDQAGGEGAAPQPAPSLENAIATVNGEAINRDEFDRQFERTKERFEQAKREIPPALEARLRENILRRMVEDVLIAQKAKAEAVDLGQEEFEAKFAEHRRRFGSDQAFQEFLTRTKQTEEDVRAELRKSLLRERLYAKLSDSGQVTDEQIREYYDKNPQRYKDPERIQASHILLKYEETDPEPLKKEKMAKCKKLVAQAQKKGADFAALAKEHSEGPTAPRGGDLGTFPRGRMVPAFEEAAFAAKPGSVIGPVETRFGCHVIKVFDKLPERIKPMEEVRASIEATLKAIQKSEQTRTLLNELRRDAKVEVLDPTLKYREPATLAQRQPAGEGVPPQPQPEGQAPAQPVEQSPQPEAQPEAAPTP